MTVGDRIRQLRMERGVTQQEIADCAGVSKQAIYKYENNVVTNIPMDKLSIIASKLGVTPCFLMGWDEGVSTRKNEWASKFREGVMQILNNADPADLEASGISIRNIEEKLSGNDPISLAMACSIADQLGESLDSLLGHTPKEMIKAALQQEDGSKAEIIELVLDLPTERQQEALRYLRYLAENANK